ncbi:MAG: DUF1501 domain-containing protein [Candidatus Tectomicrobia bacterium]|uniref:DUF1501 domain-containing protein n=1 Tax=Tectimicrobiota bacterium TaxID=2528274 RepID=A0A937VZP5_UNCTE|nr:DUF1501 domain-containing protein [Candidatus Tectomicrobia bacterium]
MASTGRDNALVILQLNGGNDCLDTVVPYTNGLYYDFRPTIKILPEEVLPLNDTLGFHPSMGPIKALWDEGNVAVMQGIGYPHPDRSHFRSMDIWHTAEPTTVAREGWLGRVIRELDPHSENVLTGINFGRGLPRALACRGVPVASVGNLETYGLFSDMQDTQEQRFALDTFARMYGGATGQDAVMSLLGQTGSEALKGADILRTAPARYTSSITYPDTSIAQNFKSMAQVLCADLGTRIFYTQHASFDTHSGELATHAKLWHEVSGAVSSFMADIREHGREENVVLLIFSEFGRRIRDNGSGTDHGSGGVAFLIGQTVRGGLYGEYPSLRLEDQLNGDLHFNNDFRCTYATLLEQWLGLQSAPIVNGQFEQFDCLV